VTTYETEIDGTLVRFSATFFSDINDYNSYVKEPEDLLFTPLIDRNIKGMVGYDWELIEDIEGSRTTTDINVYKLIKVLEYTGKTYALINNPDVVFYETDNPKLGSIYQRWCESFGYVLEYITENTYVFVKNGKGKNN